MTEHPTDLIEEDRLRAVLDRERLPEQDFLDAVEKKLRAREASADDKTEPRRLQQAAALVPLLMVSLPKAGSVAGSKLGWKLIPIVVALPVVAFLMLLVTFYYSIRAVRDSHPGTVVELRGWWRRNLVVIALIGALLAALFVMDAMFALSVMLMMSMLVFAIAMGALGRLGLTSRAAIASNIFPWLFIVGSIVFSGSLYALALTGARWWGAVTPIGGVCLILGWVVFAWGIVTAESLNLG